MPRRDGRIAPLLAIALVSTTLAGAIGPAAAAPATGGPDPAPVFGQVDANESTLLTDAVETALPDGDDVEDRTPAEDSGTAAEEAPTEETEETAAEATEGTIAEGPDAATTEGTDETSTEGTDAATTEEAGELSESPNGEGPTTTDETTTTDEPERDSEGGGEAGPTETMEPTSADGESAPSTELPLTVDEGVGETTAGTSTPPGETATPEATSTDSDAGSGPNAGPEIGDDGGGENRDGGPVTESTETPAGRDDATSTPAATTRSEAVSSDALENVTDLSGSVDRTGVEASAPASEQGASTHVIGSPGNETTEASSDGGTTTPSPPKPGGATPTDGSRGNESTAEVESTSNVVENASNATPEGPTASSNRTATDATMSANATGVAVGRATDGTVADDGTDAVGSTADGATDAVDATTGGAFATTIAIVDGTTYTTVSTLVRTVEFGTSTVDRTAESGSSTVDGTADTVATSLESTTSWVEEATDGTVGEATDGVADAVTTASVTAGSVIEVGSSTVEETVDGGGDSSLLGTLDGTVGGTLGAVTGDGLDTVDGTISSTLGAVTDTVGGATGAAGATLRVGSAGIDAPGDLAGSASDSRGPSGFADVSRRRGQGPARFEPGALDRSYAYSTARGDPTGARPADAGTRPADSGADRSDGHGVTAPAETGAAPIDVRNGVLGPPVRGRTGGDGGAEGRPAAADDGSSDGGVPTAPVVVGLLGFAVLGGLAASGATPLVQGRPSGPGVGLRLRTAAGAVRAWTGRIPRVLPIPGYSRYDDSDPLENERRAAVYEAANDSPGVHLSKIGEQWDVPRSTVRYHVRILEHEGLVTCEKVRGRRRVFPVGQEAPELAAALEDDATRSVVGAVERHEPVDVSTLASVLDRAPSTVSHHLERLEADGVVVRERSGRSVESRLAPGVADALAADGGRTKAPPSPKRRSTSD